MTQPNLFDMMFGIGVLFAILLGMMRGNGKETIHTFAFGVAMLVGWLFWRNGAPATSQEELGRMMVSISFYAFAMYVFSWALMGVLAPLMLDHGELGFRGRFWAGAQTMAKLAAVILGINLWYALNSTAPVWERLQPLPPLLRDSVILNLSDRFTEDLHRALAQKGMASYQYAPAGEAPEPTGLKPAKDLERMVDMPAPQEN